MATKGDIKGVGREDEGVRKHSVCNKRPCHYTRFQCYVHRQHLSTIAIYRNITIAIYSAIEMAIYSTIEMAERLFNFETGNFSRLVVDMTSK